MDGVLVDFDKQFKKYADRLYDGNFSFRNTRITDEEFWAIIDPIGVPFWSGPDWMPDGKTLWNYIKGYNPTILSSPSHRPVAIKGKEIWLKKHGFEGFEWIFEEKKYIHATEERILIDDFEKNITKWRNVGGIAIHHINAEQTINELIEYGFEKS